MHEHFEKLANGSFIASISVSATLILEDFIQVLDSHQGVTGFVLGSISLLMQWYYRRKATLAIIANGGERRK